MPLNLRTPLLLVALAAVMCACSNVSLPPDPTDAGPGLQPDPSLAPSSPSPTLPDSTRTPGDVLTNDLATICTLGYTKTVRNVPQSLKDAIYASYGITKRLPREYEIDHLVSLELGGSNSVRNLWPQSYITTPLNAHIKDGLENRLHDLACKGSIRLEDAQRDIATDWTKAFKKYIGPLPQSSTQLETYHLRVDASDRDGDLD